MQKRRRFFYGWWIVLAGAVISFWVAGSFYYSFGAFFDPIIKAFGWTRAQTSVAFSLQRLEGGIAAPVVGYSVDRWGPRIVIIVGGVIAALGFFLISLTDSLFWFYGAFIVIAAGFSACFYVPAQVATVNWFRRSRGKAMGFLTAGAGLSGILTPIVVVLIYVLGWREALVVIALVTLVVVVPMGFLIRHRPEPYGYLPDGKLPGESEIPAASQGSLSFKGVEYSFTLGAAMRTRFFWLLAIGLTISNTAMSAILVHEIPALTAAGLSRELAALAVTGTTLCSLIGRLGFGHLGDHMDKRLAMSFSYGLQALGVLIFAYTTTPWMIVPFVLVFGIGYGGPIPLRPALTADYLGPRYFGTIQGVQMTMTIAGGLVGPVFAGWVFDVTGAYTMAFVIMAITTALGIPFFLASTRPKIPAPPAKSEEASLASTSPS